MTFQIGETVICSLTVKDGDGNLADPTTSMKITITDNQNGTEIDNVAMVKDSTGLYHYDWQTSTITVEGIYYIIYKATDGTRISVAKDSVEIH